MAPKIGRDIFLFTSFYAKLISKQTYCNQISLSQVTQSVYFSVLKTDEFTAHQRYFYFTLFKCFQMVSAFFNIILMYFLM